MMNIIINMIKNSVFRKKRKVKLSNPKMLLHSNGLSLDIKQ